MITSRGASAIARVVWSNGSEEATRTCVSELEERHEELRLRKAGHRISSCIEAPVFHGNLSGILVVPLSRHECTLHGKVQLNIFFAWQCRRGRVRSSNHLPILLRCMLQGWLLMLCASCLQINPGWDLHAGRRHDVTGVQ